jgi:hypothetical protein
VVMNGRYRNEIFGRRGAVERGTPGASAGGATPPPLLIWHLPNGRAGVRYQRENDPKEAALGFGWSR